MVASAGRVKAGALPEIRSDPCLLCHVKNTKSTASAFFQHMQSQTSSLHLVSALTVTYSVNDLTGVYRKLGHCQLQRSLLHQCGPCTAPLCSLLRLLISVSSALIRTPYCLRNKSSQLKSSMAFNVGVYRMAAIHSKSIALYGVVETSLSLCLT